MEEIKAITGSPFIRTIRTNPIHKVIIISLWLAFIYFSLAYFDSFDNWILISILIFLLGITFWSFSIKIDIDMYGLAY